jgi:hydrogenase nickel incorporation protein HypA/HybF
MHEMSLTEGLIELVEEEGRRQGFSRVRRIRLRLGVLSHVEAGALRFCFDAVAAGTIAEGAVLEIEEVPAQAWCLDCRTAVEVGERFGVCPQCGGGHLQVAGGDEMRLHELEVD